SSYRAEGNAQDSVNNNHGSFINGATTTTTGKVGSAFRFDGVDDYVSVPDSVNLRPSQITVAAWINAQSLNHQVLNYFLSKGKDVNFSGAPGGWSFGVGGTQGPGNLF